MFCRIAVVGLLALCAAPLPAATIFFDDFNSYSASFLSTSPTGWTQTGGNVDIVKHGDWSISCLGGVGACIDLDGSYPHESGPGPAILSPALTFDLFAGYTYTLTYYLSGNQRGYGPDTVHVTFATASATHTLYSGDPFTQFTLTFTPLVNLYGQTFTFKNDGTDNQGALLDSVRLTENAIPEPGTAMLMCAGLGLAALLRRRS